MTFNGQPTQVKMQWEANPGRVGNPFRVAVGIQNAQVEYMEVAKAATRVEEYTVEALFLDVSMECHDPQTGV